MSIRIGRSPEHQDALDLMLECHVRIRDFIDAAVALGESAPPENVGVAGEQARAAARVARYFGEALPLHVADEDDSLTPRLQGRDAALDVALSQMGKEHIEHRSGLAEMNALCRSWGGTGTIADADRQRLGHLARELRTAFLAHLELEERDIFPAARRLLDASALKTLADEIRARRAAPPGAPTMPLGSQVS